MIPCLGQKVSLLLAVIVHTFTSTYSEFSCLALRRDKKRQQQEQKVTFIVAFTVHTMSAASGLNFLRF